MCQSLELRAAIMGTYLKESRNNSEAVSGKSVRNGETPKHLKFKWKRDFQSLKVMCWSIFGTRGKMKEVLSCMFETWHNPVARPLGSN